MVDLWLANLGWRVYSFGVDLSELDEYQFAGAYRGEHSPGHHLIIGRSERGTSHVVVGLDGRIVHDPSPEQTGLVAPTDAWTRWWFERIVPLHDGERS